MSGFVELMEAGWADNLPWIGVGVRFMHRTHILWHNQIIFFLIDDKFENF